jgi:hypothetical protein
MPYLKPLPFMQQRITLFQLVLCISVLFFSACKSTKITRETATQNQPEIGTCDQVIKYYSELIRMTNGEPDVKVITEVIINPSSKVISLTSEPPEQGKVSFETIIESIDCKLNSDLTEGKAIYNGYIKQKDGNSTKATLKIEAKDGYLTISNGDPQHETFIIVVSKWEIVKE